jgi:hypothetical protein
MATIVGLPKGNYPTAYGEKVCFFKKGQSPVQTKLYDFGLNPPGFEFRLLMTVNSNAEPEQILAALAEIKRSIEDYGIAACEVPVPPDMISRIVAVKKSIREFWLALSKVSEKDRSAIEAYGIGKISEELRCGPGGDGVGFGLADLDHLILNSSVFDCDGHD